MVVRFSCKICNKTVSYDSDSIQCDKCFSMGSAKEFLPFSNLDDKSLILTVKGKKNKFTNVAKKQIANKAQPFDQINLITRCEDNNIPKYFQNEEPRDLLQPCN